MIRLEYPWGHGAAAADIGVALDQNPGVDVVFLTHNETSTGVTNNLAAIAAEVKQRGKLIAVDGVSSVGSIDVPTDRLGIDVLITASQKGWMVPPGAAFISISPAAYEYAKTAQSPRFFFDFQLEQGYEAKGQTLTTPPVSLYFGLRESLKMLREEGLQNVFLRHADIANGLRAAINAMELELFADPVFFSNTVTAVRVPGNDPDLGKTFTSTLRDKYGLEVAGGQGALSGQIFRIGHLGDITREDAREIAFRLEECLQEVGYIDAPVGAVEALEAAMQQQPAAAAPTAG